MKTLKLFVAFVAIIACFTACQYEGEVNMSTEYIKGYVADDAIPLSEALTKEYSLQELKGFFGEVPQNELSGFGENSSAPGLSIDYVNRFFPIECLRKNGYSVYKVTDGGYFYVFWVKSFNTNPDDADDASVYFTAYLSTIKKSEDFDLLHENLSTAEDVAKIDPAFELTFLLSSRLSSYSLLEDGTIMEICYSFNDNFASRSDLIVESKKVISKENSPSQLASILSSDLP